MSQQFRVENIATKSIMVVGGEDFCRHRCNFANAVYDEPRFQVVPNIISDVAISYINRQQSQHILHGNANKLIRIKLPLKQTHASNINPPPKMIPELDVTVQSRVQDYLKLIKKTT